MKLTNQEKEALEKLEAQYGSVDPNNGTGKQEGIIKLLLAKGFKRVFSAKERSMTYMVTYGKHKFFISRRKHALHKVESIIERINAHAPKSTQD
jgi:hypothetical protein